MATIIQCFFGKMINAIKLPAGTPYNDWRTAYLDRPGIILILRSDNQIGHYIYFCPSTVTNEKKPYFLSSIGMITEKDESVTIITKHSRYTFVSGKFGLSPDEAERLIMLPHSHLLRLTTKSRIR